MTYIQTYTGIKFDLVNPKPEMVSPVDIAHALGRLCRFTGHTANHYSVAQHCVEVSLRVPSELALVGLLHDAAEAYVGDVSSPLKALLPAYQEIEWKVWLAIAERFNVNPDDIHLVKDADRAALKDEMKLYLNGDENGWIVPDQVWLIRLRTLGFK